MELGRDPSPNRTTTCFCFVFQSTKRIERQFEPEIWCIWRGRDLPSSSICFRLRRSRAESVCFEIPSLCCGPIGHARYDHVTGLPMNCDKNLSWTANRWWTCDEIQKCYCCLLLIMWESLTCPSWPCFPSVWEATPVYSARFSPFPSCRPCDGEFFYWNWETLRLPDAARPRRSCGRCSTFENRLDSADGSTEGGRRVDVYIGNWKNWPAAKQTVEIRIFKKMLYNNLHILSSVAGYTLSQGIPRVEMPSSISGASLGLSGGWSSLRIPGLSSPDMSWSMGTSDISLRSEMDDTFRLDRMESDRLIAIHAKKISSRRNEIGKKNTFTIGIGIAAGFSVATSQFQTPSLERPRVAHGASPK